MVALVKRFSLCSNNITRHVIYLTFCITLQIKNNALLMSDLRKINTAFISVWNKDNLDEIIKSLEKLKIRIFSTGGTASFIEKMNIAVTKVENLTGYPSIFGGRVKTLHPKIFGGILARRNVNEDREELEKYEIPAFDLVIVDLYPFEETIRSGAGREEIIEKIDIGGISLIRAAAKNFQDVLIVPSIDFYPELLEILNLNEGQTGIKERGRMAAEAFRVSSGYDTAIHNYFVTGDIDNSLSLTFQNGRKLRYGENPHQNAFYYDSSGFPFTQIHGKEISYNNILDIDAACGLINEFSEATFAVIKHNNACGLASGENLKEAWLRALEGDPVSAFGGILITNRKVDKETALEVNKLFFEIIISPGYEDEALSILKEKKNRIILINNNFELPNQLIRSVIGGVLVQDRDTKTETEKEMRVVTHSSPGESEIADLIFANKIVKHSKSNAIVLVKNNQLLGSGVGQTSRIDALRQAVDKAGSSGFNLAGAVMASDAFFPFADSVEIAHKAGISAVIQPGGSVRDQESIDFCNKMNMKMVFTGVRHFKH
jgi:phosphoribosylaminoimidazolecarboxamide formyltransferase / IMP cyclohydrolase